jgi:hypothetical protein
MKGIGVLIIRQAIKLLNVCNVSQMKNRLSSPTSLIAHYTPTIIGCVQNLWINRRFSADHHCLLF